jgi:hypothetical protein
MDFVEIFPAVPQLASNAATVRVAGAEVLDAETAGALDVTGA